MPRMSEYELVHEYETVKVRRRAGACAIELNRPEAMNALDGALAGDLRAALEAAAEDASIRAVVLRGAGRAFSSGADLKAGFELDPDGRPDLGRALRERYHPIILGIREMPKPVVAAVHGAAVGVGCSVALACDLVLASESAYFLLAFANIGLVPDGGASAFVPSRAGLARAAEMAMLGERIPAARALEWGLVNSVHADEDLDAAVEELVERLAGGPTRAYAGIKRQLNGWAYSGLEEQLELEADIQREMGRSEDFVEGVLAFMERRPATFRGA
jgi:2-(1,2-epoxy-1,2-dihydrophenyl)acetyl-CoA isomerase